MHHFGLPLVRPNVDLFGLKFSDFANSDSTFSPTDFTRNFECFPRNLESRFMTTLQGFVFNFGLSNVAICKTKALIKMEKIILRDTPSLEEDEGAECQGVSQRSDEVIVRGNTKEQNKMSPIIKVRTPTKVRELKLLSPNIAVQNLARQLSSQPKPGERVQIFGVNVMLSPKSSCAAKASESETASAVVREVDFRHSKTDGKWLNARKSGSKAPDGQESTQM